MKSAYFSSRAVKAIERIGDIMIPGDEDFPSFSETGCIEYIDELAAYAEQDDIKALNSLMMVLSFMPGFVLRWLVRKMLESHQKGTGPIHSLLRELDFGLRGLIFSCYYSGKTGSSFKGKNPLTDVVGFTVNRIID